MQLFDLISNMQRFGEWFPGVIKIQAGNDLAHGEVGKTYLETVQVPLRGKQEILLTVVESVHGERFVTEGEFAPLLPRMEIRLNQQGAEKVEVCWRMLSRTQSLAVRLLLLPLASRVLSRRANIGLQRLKRLCES